MSKEPKGQKHHYIPVFYLRQWMGARQTVCEFSRPYDRVKTRFPHPDGTGYVRGLYAIDDLDANVANAIEDMFLKPSDGMAAEALRWCYGKCRSLIRFACPLLGPFRPLAHDPLS
jgi:hypothetical protein